MSTQGETQGSRILLVEDDAIIALRQRKLLEENGYRVETVHSGKKALATALDPERSIELILMDIDLGPGMDGTEVAERVLAERDLPVVFLTSHAEQEMVSRVKGITRYGYVLKRSGDFVLLESIAMALELFETRQALERSRDLYRSVANLTGDIIVRHDAEGHWTFLNNEAVRRWQISVEGNTDRHFMETVHPEDQERTREAGEWMRSSGQPVSGLVNRTWTVDGWRNYEWNSAPIFDASGRYLGHQATGRDITERLEVQRQLLLKDRALETAMAGVAMADHRGRITYANAAALELWGFDTLREVLGRRALAFWKHPRDVIRFMKQLGEKHQVSGRLEARGPKGRSFPVRVAASTVTDAQGHLLSYMAWFFPEEG